MKLYRILGVAVALLALPVAVSAMTVVSGEQYGVAARTAIPDNAYIAAGTVTVAGTAERDVYAAGGTVLVTGAVGEDAVLVGGTITLTGIVGGDLRAVGGNVTIGQDVGGDLVVIGGTVHVLPDAVIGGDVILLGGQLVMDGSIDGSLRVLGGQLLLGGSVKGDVNARVSESLAIQDAARIGGALTYAAPRAGTIPDGAVAGDVQYTPWQRADTRAFGDSARAVLWTFVGLAAFAKLLSLAVLVLTLVLAWPRFANAFLAVAHKEMMPSAGRGLVLLIVVPIAILLLLVSVVGSLAGVLALFVFIPLLILAYAYAMVLTGSLVVRIFQKQYGAATWQTALIGCVVFLFLGAIPLLGGLVKFFLLLISFGVLASELQRVLRK